MIRAPWLVPMPALACAAALALAAGPAAVAGPTPPARAAQRKPASEAFPGRALTAFVEAIIADKAGEWWLAANRYRDANKISPQPSTYYNLADLLRRMEDLGRAVEAYRKYLELAPDAPDRAQVEQLIEQLERSPGTAVIDGEEPDAVVLVDGNLIGPSPAVVQLPEGRHVADRISPTGYTHRSFHVTAARTIHVATHHSKDITGNVVLASSSRITLGGAWDDGGVRYEFPGRISLPPGRYETHPFGQRSSCNPIVFEVTPGPELTYVYVDGERVNGCLRVTTHQSKLRLAP